MIKRGGTAAWTALLVVTSTNSPAEAQTRPTTPIGAAGALAQGFDVQVAIDDENVLRALRTQPDAATTTWEAQLEHGGAIVRRVEALTQAQPPARLEIALTFDNSESFRGQLRSAQRLASEFIDSSFLPGLDTTVSVHVIGQRHESLGRAHDADTARMLVQNVLKLRPQQRTDLRLQLAEIVEQTGDAVRFPDGVRELVLFSDGGEESDAYQNFATVTGGALARGVIVDAIVFQPDSPSRRAATLIGQLFEAVGETGGLVVNVNPGSPLARQTLGEVRSTAGLPRSLFHLQLEACGLTTQGTGAHQDSLSFVVTMPGQPPWRSKALPVNLQVHGGVPACPAGGSTASAGNGASTIAAAPGAGKTAPASGARATGDSVWWPLLLAGGLIATILALVGLSTRRRRADARGAAATGFGEGGGDLAGHGAADALKAPPSAATATVPKLDTSRAPIAAPSAQPIVPGPAQQPLVVPAQAPWLEPQKANPLVGALPTELHVEATPIELGSLLRVARPEIRVGRDPEMELSLEIPEVSNHHATLYVEPDGELYVVDVGSTNGTYLAQKRLPANERLHVPPGSELWFSTQIRLRVVQPWRATPAPSRSAPLPGHVVRRARTVVDPGDPKEGA